MKKISFLFLFLASMRCQIFEKIWRSVETSKEQTKTSHLFFASSHWVKSLSSKETIGRTQLRAELSKLADRMILRAFSSPAQLCERCSFVCGLSITRHRERAWTQAGWSNILVWFDLALHYWSSSSIEVSDRLLHGWLRGKEELDRLCVIGPCFFSFWEKKKKSQPRYSSSGAAGDDSIECAIKRESIRSIVTRARFNRSATGEREENTFCECYGQIFDSKEREREKRRGERKISACTRTLSFGDQWSNGTVDGEFLSFDQHAGEISFCFSDSFDAMEDERASKKTKTSNPQQLLIQYLIESIQKQQSLYGLNEFSKKNIQRDNGKAFVFHIDHHHLTRFSSQTLFVMHFTRTTNTCKRIPSMSSRHRRIPNGDERITKLPNVVAILDERKRTRWRSGNQEQVLICDRDFPLPMLSGRLGSSKRTVDCASRMLIWNKRIFYFGVDDILLSLLKWKNGFPGFFLHIVNIFMFVYCFFLSFSLRFSPWIQMIPAIMRHRWSRVTKSDSK